MKIKALLREQKEIGKDGYKTRVERAPSGIDLIEDLDDLSAPYDNTETDWKKENDHE